MELSREIIEQAEVIVYIKEVDQLDLFIDSMLLSICKYKVKKHGFYTFKYKGVKTLITLKK